VNPNRDDAVIRASTLSKGDFLSRREVGDFSRLDGSDLRIDLELPCIIDGGGCENLFQRQSRFLKLLHFQITVQAGEVSVGRAGEQDQRLFQISSREPKRDAASEIFGEDDGDVGDPGSARRLTQGRTGQHDDEEK